jgi:3-oxoacyl-[acyl-carrier protein] reductase
MSDFEGQAAVVIGAGAGIGRATALLLAQRGASVACVDRDHDAALKTAREIGAEAMAASADVGDEASVHQAFEQAASTFGQLHVAINCAGISGTTGKKSHEVELDDFDKVVKINLRGALVVSQTAIRHMLEHNYGRVVHVASIAGKEGNANMIAYSSTKAGLIGMVKAQGKEYAETGITVNALAPAVIRTDLVAALPDEVVTYMTDKIPMKRTGTVDEAAAMLAFIASKDCSFTTGFTFDLSGGRATY